MSVDVRQVGPTSSLWDEPDFVLALSTTDLDELAYWRRTVSPAAHNLAHPKPVHACPGCPPGGDAEEDRGAEIHYWRKAAV